MNAKQKKIEYHKSYLKRNGLLKTAVPMLRRTENGVVYHYRANHTIPWTKFMSQERDLGREPLFANFIQTLTDFDQSQIVIEKLN